MNQLTVTMTKEQAQECVEIIQGKIKQAEEHFKRGESALLQAREVIYNLHHLQGWRALGYTSWEQCVKELFERNRSHLFRELAAAIVEKELDPDATIGKIRERVLRPLTKKGFSSDARRTLWEVARLMVGDEKRITSGVMNEVIETLSDAVATGATQNESGEQSPVWEKLQADALARIVEMNKRKKQHLNGVNEDILVFSSVPAKTHVNGQKRVFLEVTGVITHEALQMLLNPKFSVKLSAWIESVKSEVA